MAAQDTFASYQASSEHSVFGNGLIRVLGARGIESAETLTENFTHDTMIEGKSLLIEAYDDKNRTFEHIVIVPRILNLSSLWYTESKTNTNLSPPSCGVTVMKTIEHKHLTWINFEEPTADDITYLQENFNIHPLAIEELVTPTYQPKVVQYDGCLFFSIHIPLFDTKLRTTYPGELDIILTKEHLITSHKHSIYQLTAFFEQLEKSEGKRRLYLEHGPARLLHHILEILLNSCFPKLDHITEKLDFIEMQVFSGKEKEMVLEISVLKRDILNFRRTLKPQRSIIESLIQKDHPHIPDDFTIYYQDLIGTNIRLWNLLESQKETIEALEDTNNSLLSNKLDQTMKVLTIFSAILLPLTAYSNMMSMNAAVPFINSHFGFWIHLTIMGVISLVTFGIFRWRRWL